MMVYRAESSVRGAGSSIVSVPFGDCVRVSEPSDVIAVALMEEFKKLCALPRGWDGYNGAPVGFDVASFAYDSLRRLCSQGDALPSLVPGPSGDVQAEWHTLQGDVELHFIKPNVVKAYYESVNGEELYLDIDTDFSVIAKLLKFILADDDVINRSAA